MRRIIMALPRKKLTSPYPFGGPERLPIPENKINWSIPWPEYSPPYFISDRAKSKPWADKDISLNNHPKWNSNEDGINRRSHTGDYLIDEKGYPLNPSGRTGLAGRGVLGRWASNHAADPVVTKWKRDDLGGIVKQDSKKVLQFIGIQRRDTEEWAFPGGMVDPGEEPCQTLKREFLEEVFSIEGANDSERVEIERILGDLFDNGVELYKGIADDPRNTDNSWIETTAVLFHIESKELGEQLKFKAGSDAKNAEWIDIHSNLKLYANHKDFLEKAVHHLDAFW